MMLTIHKLPQPVIAKVQGLGHGLRLPTGRRGDFGHRRRQRAVCHVGHPRRPLLLYTAGSLGAAREPQELLLTGDYRRCDRGRLGG
ncbi:MAG: hypothetical protein R3A10_21880 [Caldilineaceae bacterium]